MLLISYWEGLSDEKVENYVASYIPAMVFCGLSITDTVPDHSTLNRFRKLLVENKCIDKLLHIFNTQLKEKQIILSSGIHVDAILTSSPRSPHKRPRYEIAEDRKEDERSQEDESQENKEMEFLRVEESSVDTEGRWLKKRGESIFGYKETVAVNDDGLILSIDTTAANIHDSHGLAKVIR